MTSGLSVHYIFRGRLLWESDCLSKAFTADPM